MHRSMREPSGNQAAASDYLIRALGQTVGYNRNSLSVFSCSTCSFSARFSAVKSAMRFACSSLARASALTTGR